MSSRCEYSYGRLPFMVPAACSMDPFSVALSRGRCWPGTCAGSTLGPVAGCLKYCDRGNEYAHECGGMDRVSPPVAYDVLLP